MLTNRSKYIQTKILVHFILTTVLLFRMEKEFLIKWGNRSNVDNWRTYSVSTMNTGLQNEIKQNFEKELSRIKTYQDQLKKKIAY